MKLCGSFDLDLQFVFGLPLAKNIKLGVLAATSIK